MPETIDKWDAIYPKMQYWTKMQIGKEFYFILFLSGDPREIEELEIMDIKVKEITIYDLYAKAKEINKNNIVHSSFLIRLSSPALKIEPSIYNFKYFLSDKGDVKEFIFRIVPNHYGKFQVLLEFIKNDVVFFNKILEISIQKKGIQIKNLQISNSLVSFLSICITAMTILPSFFSLELPILILILSMGFSFALLIFWLYNRTQHNTLIQFSKNPIQKIAFRFDKISPGFEKLVNNNISTIRMTRAGPRPIPERFSLKINNGKNKLNRIFIPIDDFPDVEDDY